MLKFASVFMIIALSSSISAGVVAPLAYSAYPAPYTSQYFASPFIARSAPLIAQPHFHPRTIAAPLVRSAPFIQPAAPVLAKTVVPAPIVAARTILPVAAPVIKTADNDAYPQYQFAYNVNDQLTGDNKAHEEIRDGDIVKGYYTLAESDGTRRKVTYYADPINGFNAVVERSAPVIAAAPVVEPVAKVVVA